ncbi:hypothetical protein [Halorussus caseinilyticus]|uniref:Uncharacterized protein n=1 Tax=Halorussus caseinilyticus TaxID=3034025 RepID=A0ABD5WN84_9EURY
MTRRTITTDAGGRRERPPETAVVEATAAGEGSRPGARERTPVTSRPPCGRRSRSGYSRGTKS